MAALSIRPARASDVEDLGAIFVSSSMSNEGDRPNLLAHPDVMAFPGTGVSEGRTRVAVNGEERPVGFATYAVAGRVMEVEDLFVEPGGLRRGVGRELMADLVECARGMGLARLEGTANPHALAFYEAVGFVQIGRVATRFAEAPRMALEC